MDDQQIGRIIRALRQRLGKRQSEVAAAANVSQNVISRAEIGRLESLSLRVLRRVAHALGAEVVVTLRWRGAELDRLLDQGHAALAGAVTELLTSLGWEVQAEVSYSIWGERGSIDLLAWH